MVQFIIAEIISVFELLQTKGYSFGEVKRENIYWQKHTLVFKHSDSLTFQIFGSNNASATKPNASPSAQNLKDYHRNNLFDLDYDQISKADIAGLGPLIFTLATGKEVEENTKKFLEFK